MSARQRRDGDLLEAIAAIHGESNGTYGWPRIHAELRHRGIDVSRKRVARLMRWAGLSGMVRRFLTNASARSRLQPYAYAKSRRVGDSQRPWPGPVETSVSGSGSVALFATSRAMRSALSRCRRPAAGGSRDQFRGGAAWRRRRPSALGGRARSRRVSVQSKVSGGGRSS
jgi:hypothetical protein